LGDRTLVFTTRLEHCKLLYNLFTQAGIPSEMVTGAVEEREHIKKSFEAGGIKCLIVTTVFDTGVDFVGGVDCLVNASAGTSLIRTLQRTGRGLRLQNNNWNKFLVFDFIDPYQFFTKQSNTRKETYKLEDFSVTEINSSGLEDEIDAYYEEKAKSINS